MGFLNPPCWDKYTNRWRWRQQTEAERTTDNVRQIFPLFWTRLPPDCHSPLFAPGSYLYQRFPPWFCCLSCLVSSGGLWCKRKCQLFLRIKVRLKSTAWLTNLTIVCWTFLLKHLRRFKPLAVAMLFVEVGSRFFEYSLPSVTVLGKKCTDDSNIRYYFKKVVRYRYFLCKKMLLQMQCLPLLCPR